MNKLLGWGAATIVIYIIAVFTESGEGWIIRGLIGQDTWYARGGYEMIADRDGSIPLGRVGRQWEMLSRGASEE
jgi:hypothetical protein